MPPAKRSVVGGRRSTQDKRKEAWQSRRGEEEEGGGAREASTDTKSAPKGERTGREEMEEADTSRRIRTGGKARGVRLQKEGAAGRAARGDGWIRRSVAGGREDKGL